MQDLQYKKISSCINNIITFTVLTSRTLTSLPTLTRPSVRDTSGACSLSGATCALSLASTQRESGTPSRTWSSRPSSARSLLSAQTSRPLSRTGWWMGINIHINLIMNSFHKIPYRGKLSREKTCTNFAVLCLSAKVFSSIV